MAIEAWGISAEGQHLLDAALRLPEREREIVAERLHASLENIGPDAAWEQAWSDELDRRDAELDSGDARPLALEDIRQLMREARNDKAGS